MYECMNECINICVKVYELCMERLGDFSVPCNPHGDEPACAGRTTCRPRNREIGQKWPKKENVNLLLLALMRVVAILIFSWKYSTL